jgi:hypothetical protein
MTIIINRSVLELEPGDHVIYRNVAQDVECEILTAREDHIDVTGLPVGRWTARRTDTDAMGILVFGDKAYIDVVT